MESLDFESKVAIAKLACWAFTILCAWGWVEGIIGAIRGLAATISSEANQNRRQLGELTRPLDDFTSFQKDERERRRQAGGEVHPVATELLGKVRRQ